MSDDQPAIMKLDFAKHADSSQVCIKPLIVIQAKLARTKRNVWRQVALWLSNKFVVVDGKHFNIGCYACPGGKCAGESISIEIAVGEGEVPAEELARNPSS